MSDNIDRDTLVSIFKTGWHLADNHGEVGHRTEAGIDAVIAHLAAQPVTGTGLQAHNAKLITEFMEQPEFKAMLDAVKAAAWSEGHEVGGSNYGLGDIEANPYALRTSGEETT